MAFAVRCLVVFVTVYVSTTSANMYCHLHDLHSTNSLESSIDKALNNCPQPIGNSDDKFCCIDFSFKPYCCASSKFALTIFIGIVLCLIPILIILCLLAWCCCRALCCCCCL